jgi:CheY-like chemotaxis protein
VRALRDLPECALERAAGNFRSMDTNRSIIVADDDDELREILEAVLQGAGYTVFAVGDAASVLALVDQGVRPCLVLCDFHMPGLAVPELVSCLRADERTFAVSVAVMTGARNLSLPPSTIRLDKPFEIQALLELVQKVWAPRRRRVRTGELETEGAE